LHFATLRLPHVNNQDGEEVDFDESAALWKAGMKKESQVIPFSPVFLSKDVFVMGVYFILFFYLVFYHFDFAMDPVNYDPADALKTPAHIYPEWYFLWSYEILRPFNKDLGLILFAVAQVIFFALPFLDRSSNVAPASRRGLFKIWFWVLLVDVIVLTFMGKLPPTDPMFAMIGLISAVLFFVLWLVLPFITMIEKKIEE
jgi:ubiquinol-cytochrome c reductase cytochrome b subunit